MIAEVIGGICLGPSVLGLIPHFTEVIFPNSSLPLLSLVANIGLVLYLFLVGLELDPNEFFRDIKNALIISAAGIVLPLALGFAISYGMFIQLLVPNVNNIPFTSFMLFIGVALAITVRAQYEFLKYNFLSYYGALFQAFPVLARILTEFSLLTTPVGLITVTAAALNDVAAW